MADRAGLQFLREHVVLDQEVRAPGDQPFQRRQAGADVVGRVDPLADIVQQRCLQKLLVVGPALLGQFEHLQQVKQHIPLGVIARRLLDALQRRQQRPKRLVRFFLRLRGWSIQVGVRILAADQLLKLADRGPLDRLAGDRASEDIVRLVFRIDGQLEGKAIGDVDVREGAGLAVLDDLLALDLEHIPLALEQAGDAIDAIAEQVQVDVGAVADVAGHDAADEPRPERAQQTHESQGGEAHLAQILGACLALVQAGEVLDQVADLGVGGEVAGLDGAAAEAFGGFALGGEVLGLHAVVHQAGGFKGDGMPESCIGHPFSAPVIGSPCRAARGLRPIYPPLRGVGRREDFMRGQYPERCLAPHGTFFRVITMNGSNQGDSQKVHAQLHALFEVEWQRFLREFPLLASELGDKRYNSAWPDLNMEALERRHRADRAALEQLAAIDAAALSPADRLHLALFRKKYETAVEEFPLRWWLLPLTAREGIQDANAVADAITFEGTQDYEDWLSRLERFHEYMRQTIALMREGIRTGMVHPKVVMQRVPSQIRRQIAPTPEESLFFKPFRTFHASVPEAERNRLAGQAKR